MLLKEIVGKYDDSCGYEIKSEAYGDWWCSQSTLRALRRFFHVPQNTKRFWIQFHDRPATQRVKCEVVERIDKPSGYCIWSLKGPGFMVDRGELDGIINPLTGRTVYVEVWYED